MGENYIFMGCANGRFDAELRDGTTEKRLYFNLYVYSPVSAFESEDYKATGFKCEKFSCTGSEVCKDIDIGEEVTLYFNEKKKVTLISSTGRRVTNLMPE